MYPGTGLNTDLSIDGHLGGLHVPRDRTLHRPFHRWSSWWCSSVLRSPSKPRHGRSCSGVWCAQPGIHSCLLATVRYRPGYRQGASPSRPGLGKRKTNKWTCISLYRTHIIRTSHFECLPHTSKDPILIEVEILRTLTLKSS